jgi:hypothetical protein
LKERALKLLSRREFNQPRRRLAPTASPLHDPNGLDERFDRDRNVRARPREM